MDDDVSPQARPQAAAPTRAGRRPVEPPEPEEPAQDEAEAPPGMLYCNPAEGMWEFVSSGHGEDDQPARAPRS